MSESKIKEQRRREHAAKIVAAFENFIKVLIESHGSTDHPFDVEAKRTALIDTLVTPPPKV